MTIAEKLRRRTKMLKRIKDAGNVEQNIAFANKGMGLAAGTKASDVSPLGGMAENTKTIHAMLKRLDEESENKYSLLEKYTALKLSKKQKGMLGKLLTEKADAAKIHAFLECSLSDSLEEDADITQEEAIRLAKLELKENPDCLAVVYGCLDNSKKKHIYMVPFCVYTEKQLENIYNQHGKYLDVLHNKGV